MFVNILPKLSFWLYIYILNFFPLIDFFYLFIFCRPIFFMLNTDGMILSYIHINMPGGTQSRGMAPLALVLNLLARRKTMYLRQGKRLGIYLQNLLIVSFFVTLHVKLGVDLIPLVGRNEEITKGFSVEASSWQKSPGYEDEFVAPCSSFLISLVLFFSLNWNRLQSYECKCN